jgi:hypothetical protein
MSTSASFIAGPVRKACDSCHKSRKACSGFWPCAFCVRNNRECSGSVGADGTGHGPMAGKGYRKRNAKDVQEAGTGEFGLKMMTGRYAGGQMLTQGSQELLNRPSLSAQASGGINRSRLHTGSALPTEGLPFTGGVLGSGLIAPDPSWSGIVAGCPQSYTQSLINGGSHNALPPYDRDTTQRHQQGLNHLPSFTFPGQAHVHVDNGRLTLTSATAMSNLMPATHEGSFMTSGEPLDTNTSSPMVSPPLLSPGNGVLADALYVPNDSLHFGRQAGADTTAYTSVLAGGSQQESDIGQQPMSSAIGLGGEQQFLTLVAQPGPNTKSSHISNEVWLRIRDPSLSQKSTRTCIMCSTSGEEGCPCDGGDPCSNCLELRSAGWDIQCCYKPS